MPSSCAPSTLSRRTIAPVATSACPKPTSCLVERFVLGLAAGEIPLRGRRAVVRRVELAPGEEDRAGEALRPQRGGGGRRGDAAADEQDVHVAVGHRRPGTVPDRRPATPRGAAW